MREKYYFSPTDDCWVISKIFMEPLLLLEYKTSLSIWLPFENSQHELSSMMLCLWDLCLSTAFTLNVVINTRFSSLLMFLRNGSLLGKKTCCYEYVIFILLIKCMRNSAWSIFMSFSSSSRMWTDMYWGQTLTSRVILHEWDPSNSIEISWLRTDEHPGQGSSLSDVSPE